VGDIFVRAEDTWRAAVWSSADGVTWEQSFVGVEPTDRTEATSAVVVGDALVVAIARGVPDSFDKVGELVVRDAGGTWSRIPHPAGEKLLTLATDGASLYAFGGALGAPTSIWVSHDLETWQKLSDRSGMPPAKTWRDSGNPSPQVFSYPGGIAYLEGITRPSLVVSGPPPWSTTGDE
ncbi:MAG TPA: hypothetical protein PK890_09370, partial [Terrimesophilobacter sp.]|nr:hypothetical protein [Terrimesophilobacter sp.]